MPAPTGLQALSPWCARLCLGVERFLRELNPDGLAGRPLVLAVSAGSDSTALARILSLLAPRLGFAPVAAHLDHGLRPDSPDDLAFCARLARDLGMPFHARAADVRALAASERLGIEDAGRRARYAWLEEVRRETGADAVAVAHHLDDLAEDQLLRLIRGAGWPALGGMPAWDPPRRLLRPLLLTPKRHLLNFLDETGTAWREDPSNADPAFARNRIRHDVLPLFARENPDYLARAAELWRQARQDEAHWAEQAVLAGTEEPGGDGSLLLTARTLRDAPQALRLRLYKRAVESLGPGQTLGESLRRLDAAWLARAKGKRLQFPGGKEAVVEQGGVRFRPSKNSPEVDTSPGER